MCICWGLRLNFTHLYIDGCMHMHVHRFFPSLLCTYVNLLFCICFCSFVLIAKECMPLKEGENEGEGGKRPTRQHHHPPISSPSLHTVGIRGMHTHGSGMFFKPSGRGRKS